MNEEILKAARDLRPSERRFLAAIQRFGFCRFECVSIKRGELVLDPWPKTVRGILFGSKEAADKGVSGHFELKRQVVELFEWVRTVESGEIRCLEIKHGLPFSMEVEHRPDAEGGRDE